MIILITGPTHAGKTILAQRLLEKNNIPYYSQDHLKMGLIRSGFSSLTPEASDVSMTEFIWPVTREIIKTAVENKQNIIVEGCYIPFDWKKDFDKQYLQEIKYVCLCFSDDYIEANYDTIIAYECCIENRKDTGYCSKELLKREHHRFHEGCAKNGLPCVLIQKDYKETVNSIEI